VQPDDVGQLLLERRVIGQPNLSIMCGFRPRACQIRCTVAALTRTACPSSGNSNASDPSFERSVACTIASTVSAEMLGLGPRPARTCANLANPSPLNRRRHDRTDVAETLRSVAIRSLATPSAAISNAPPGGAAPRSTEPGPATSIAAR